MKRSFWLCCTFALVLPFTHSTGVNARPAPSRQYYSDGKTVGHWTYYKDQECYGCYYKYKPHANYDGYMHHVAYYYPSRPKYVYYYNPEEKHYWGRCPLKPTKDNPYQILDYPHRKANLKDIDEKNFTPLPAKVTDPVKGAGTVKGPMPPVPGSTDGEQMDPPPPPPKE